MFQAQSLLLCILFLSGELQTSSSRLRTTQDPPSPQSATTRNEFEFEDIANKETKRLEEISQVEEACVVLLQKIQLIISSTFSDIEGLVQNYSLTGDLYNHTLKDIQVLQNTTLQQLEELKFQIWNNASVPTQGPTTSENELSLQTPPTSVPTQDPVSTGKELCLQNPPTGASSCTTELSNPPANGTHEDPAHSCADLPKGFPSGYYWVKNNCNKTPARVYCDMTRSCCNDTEAGGWTRIADINMARNRYTKCPVGFSLLDEYSNSPRRLCDTQTRPVCTVPLIFVSFGIKYSRVCGKIIGYQYGHPYAFQQYSLGRVTSIDSYYVDGVSLTYGFPPNRKHLWTFAAGSDEASAGSNVCPCIRGYSGSVPPFVGQDYFCETANHASGPTSGRDIYTGDPLWDGDGCVSGSSSCCCFNNPPWFCKQLPEPTTDDIELRLCNSQTFFASGTPLESVELYIK